MPTTGVFRPYNLVDVISTLNQQSTASSSGTTITTLGSFAEADETLGVIDSATAVTQVASTQVWDSGTNWGLFTWG